MVPRSSAVRACDLTTIVYVDPRGGPDGFLLVVFGATMRPLYEILDTRRDDVMVRWNASIRGTSAPEAMPTPELADHIPEFVSEIAAALRMDAGLPANRPRPEKASTAAGHGAQRLRLGFSLDSVVREYGALREAIVTTANEHGVVPTARELHILFETIIVGIAHAVSEYTHQRDAELLRQANEHFAFIAHELRNPLSSATTAFELLRTRALLPAANIAVDALERGLRRTSELIEQTLQLARMASGIELHRQATTIRALFDDVALGASSEAEAKEVRLEIEVADDQRLALDVRLMRSALGNLVRNAVKYTQSRSVVEVRGRVADGRVVFEIEDCCGGLPPGRVEEAFAPFVRLDHQESGFGLGLAIAKQAADAHGGSIRVQNLPGKGCMFVLDLPIVAAG